MCQSHAPIRRRQRRGAAAVEFTLAAMIFFMLLLGSFEFGRVYMLRHDMDTAAYEAARLAALPGANSDDVEDFAHAFLRRIGALEADFDVDASTGESGADVVTVQIEFDLSQYGWLTPALARGGTISRRCTLAAEKGKLSPLFQSAMSGIDTISLLEAEE